MDEDSAPMTLRDVRRAQATLTLRLHSLPLRGGFPTAPGRSASSLSTTDVSDAAPASGSSGVTVIHHHHHAHHHHHHYAVTPIASPAEPAAPSFSFSPPRSSSHSVLPPPAAAPAAPVAGAAAAADVSAILPTDPIVFRSLIQLWRSLCEAGNLDGLLDLFSEECVFETYRGEVVGRQQILPLLERSLNRGFHFCRASFDAQQNSVTVVWLDRRCDEDAIQEVWKVAHHRIERVTQTTGAYPG